MSQVEKAQLSSERNFAIGHFRRVRTLAWDCSKRCAKSTAQSVLWEGLLQLLDYPNCRLCFCFPSQ